MLWDFHGLRVEGLWDGAPIGERWLATFAPRAASPGGGQERPSAPPAGPRPGVPPPEVTVHLALVDAVPPAPSASPDFQQGDLLAYYLGGRWVTAHFPRFGQLQLDLARGTTTGAITSAALETYGVFEDLLAIGLSPHFRRRGMFLMHAFAAATRTPLLHPRTARRGEAGERIGVLLVGDIGAGKTTTGLALLHAGWKLLSNDSPILKAGPDLKVLAYPGLLSAYPDTLSRFPELTRLHSSPERREKILFAAESIYPGVWLDSAVPGAIVFPQIESRPDHTLERLPRPEALRLILPHAIEPWDREMIPAHLALLNQLIRAAPAYRLRLGPDSSTLPDVMASVL